MGQSLDISPEGLACSAKCGARNKANQILCPDCWKLVPKKLRQNFLEEQKACQRAGRLNQTWVFAARHIIAVAQQAREAAGKKESAAARAAAAMEAQKAPEPKP